MSEVKEIRAGGKKYETVKHEKWVRETERRKEEDRRRKKREVGK